MKTVLTIGLAMLLLALDWAALHDILSGESNLFTDYGIIIISMIIFGVMAYLELRKKGRGRRGPDTI